METDTKPAEPVIPPLLTRMMNIMGVTALVSFGLGFYFQESMRLVYALLVTFGIMCSFCCFLFAIMTFLIYILHLLGGGKEAKQ